jgi:FkbM family methyltransferase
MSIKTIKVSIGRQLRPYPSIFGWARRIGNLFGITSPIDYDYIFDLARRRGRDVFFLQVGANDGLLDDPIHYLVRVYGWRGILMEPVAYLFDRLKANYSGVHGPIFVNAALSEIDGSATFYRIRMADHLPAWCVGLGSFRRDVILSIRNDVPDIESHIVEESIESISFRSLIDRYQPPRIDLVVIDTEGYDLEILRQIDLIRFRPDLIVYEHKHLTESDRRIAADLLTARGYRVVNTSWANTVAISRQPSQVSCL